MQNNAYGFSIDSTTYIKSYLSGRFQRTNINNTFSSWSEIYLGVPQGSILGPLLFNIFLNDIFYFVNNSSLCNYADDNTLFAFDRDKEKVKTDLYSDFETLHTWFLENYIVLNPEKCHFMCLHSKMDYNETFSYKHIALENSSEVTLLGVTIDRIKRISKNISLNKPTTKENNIPIICKGSIHLLPISLDVLL